CTPPLSSPTSCPPPAAPHPFPTRRSSDLPSTRRAPPPCTPGWTSRRRRRVPSHGLYEVLQRRPCTFVVQRGEHRQVGRDEPLVRSEEHTSELQSLRHLVCRLLLEK